MASDLASAPVLSTPSENVFEDPTPIAQARPDTAILSDDGLREVYEIERTAREIREGGWSRIGLQFPDFMLSDSARVVEQLSALLAIDSPEPAAPTATTHQNSSQPRPPAKIYVLADTSYSACCVDEIAAQHVDAHVVVHYGRSCLSPTSRIPVIYVFTRHPLDHDDVTKDFTSTYQDKDAKIVLMADVIYQDHLPALFSRLRDLGFTNLITTTIVRDPAGSIPNRAFSESASGEPLPEEPKLSDHDLFHIGAPPTALLLALHSRVRSLHIHEASASSSSPTATSAAALIRRRFARVLALASAGVVGILVNTLSVSGSLAAVDSLRRAISAAGKKSYTVVVGKLNPPKLANFAEIEGWVVVGCWESGLVEDEGSYYRPIVTPFEMSVALKPEEERVWGIEWWGGVERLQLKETADEHPATNDEDEPVAEVEGGVEGEESAPPEYDLRTGRLISSSRPMRRTLPQRPANGTADAPQKGSDALIRREVAGDVAAINGVLSPGAEFLRSKRTWQGLGTDYDYSETSTVVEEGLRGVARGYAGGQQEKT